MSFVSHAVDQFDVILFHHLDSIKLNKIVSAKIVWYFFKNTTNHFPHVRVIYCCYTSQLNPSYTENKIYYFCVLQSAFANHCNHFIEIFKSKTVAVSKLGQIVL